jgi:hypothetical protein
MWNIWQSSQIGRQFMSPRHSSAIDKNWNDAFLSRESRGNFQPHEIARLADARTSWRACPFWPDQCDQNIAVFQRRVEAALPIAANIDCTGVTEDAVRPESGCQASRHALTNYSGIVASVREEYFSHSDSLPILCWLRLTFDD